MNVAPLNKKPALKPLKEYEPIMFEPSMSEAVVITELGTYMSANVDPLYRNPLVN